jgi:hypothetical protein
LNVLEQVLADAAASQAQTAAQRAKVAPGFSPA